VDTHNAVNEMTNIYNNAQQQLNKAEDL